MAIISFRHNFIFVKTRKTAGTSIEVDLSQRVEAEAIVTEILPPIADHQPRNHLAEDGSRKFYNHMSAIEIRSLLGEKAFNRMFKFCVEREPVSKCISHFHMLRNSPLHNPGGAYQDNWETYCESRNFPVDQFAYSENHEGERRLLMDRVIPFEALHQDLPKLLQGFGIEGFSIRSRAKSEYARNRLVAVEDVTPQQRDIIYTQFKSSISLTGLYSR